MEPVEPRWPGLRKPTSLIGGQSVWSWTGSELIACGRESVLKKLTCPPRPTCTSVGVTPDALIVMVTSSEVGEDGLLLPHADVARQIANPESRRYWLIRRRSIGHYENITAWQRRTRSQSSARSDCRNVHSPVRRCWFARRARRRC